MRRKSTSSILKSCRFYIGIVVLLFLFFTHSSTFAQQVKASIDSTSMKIGEQISYKINVEADSTDTVLFPEGQTFMPLEMVSSTDVDTLSVKKRFQLVKEYALTQFDSGHYTIPRQQILINNSPFFTDSLKLEVRTVAVDTTKQALYPIKPSVEVEKPFSIPSWVWWLLGGILVLAALIWFILKQKKKREEAKKEIPPYEKAMLTLKKLDESNILESGDVKTYYSNLTDAVRRYLDKKIDDRALESTTSELILLLKDLKNQHKIEVEESVITNLESILKRADLAKFAGIKPDRLTAKEDRKAVQQDIDAFKTAVPEPTEEELLQNEAYLEEKRKRKRKRVIIVSIIGGLAAIVLALVIFVGVKGYEMAKDQLLGTPTKELLKGDWIESEYGTPPITVTTPEVLVRNKDSLAFSVGQENLTAEVFSYGPLFGDFHVMVSTTPIPPQVQFDLNKTVDGIQQEMEKNGARNILMKDEKFTTVTGEEGLKIFGSAVYKNPITKQDQEKSYVIINLVENQGLEQVTVIYNKGDKYAEEITGRIINSIQFNKEN
ncbi:DUF4381 domain-containing protein [Mesonia maritima]|uniref:Flagellar basal body-associated protein FliL n=1 Tax=Mesonia maritima TaxID=1793873 RepID=A0ABU1K229_9FLAO|nr:DUF4381 domain-containing protein [Mesonia maritima]MDR6299660.1 flagellar basal body-associated protein FliL [Mesonia maritima]